MLIVLRRFNQEVLHEEKELSLNVESNQNKSKMRYRNLHFVYKNLLRDS